MTDQERRRELIVELDADLKAAFEGVDLNDRKAVEAALARLDPALLGELTAATDAELAELEALTAPLMEELRGVLDADTGLDELSALLDRLDALDQTHPPEGEPGDDPPSDTFVP